jgi:hypothetical protein
VDETVATREVVIRAFKAKKYIVTEEQGSFWVTINDGKRPMRRWIPPELGRRYLNETIKNFGIPKEWILDPLCMPGEEEDREPC